jgi:hypothetical protein
MDQTDETEVPAEPPTPEAAHHFLKDDNNRRVEALKVATNGKVILDGAFESMKATTYLKHILLDLGVLDRADLDFEGQRSQALDQIEKEVAEHQAQLEAAQRMAVLQGQGGPPVHNGRVTRPVNKNILPPRG